MKSTDEMKNKMEPEVKDKSQNEAERHAVKYCRVGFTVFFPLGIKENGMLGL